MQHEHIGLLISLHFVFSIDPYRCSIRMGRYSRWWNGEWNLLGRVAFCSLPILLLVPVPISKNNSSSSPKVHVTFC